MKVQVKISKTKWREAEATINDAGHAVVKLKFPYEDAIFKEWKLLPKRSARGEK